MACGKVYPHTPTHARSAPLELFLQSLTKELLCVMQQNQLCLVFQFGTRIVLLDRLALYFLLAKLHPEHEQHALSPAKRTQATRATKKNTHFTSHFTNFMCFQLFLSSLLIFCFPHKDSFICCNLMHRECHGNTKFGHFPLKK